MSTVDLNNVQSDYFKSEGGFTTSARNINDLSDVDKQVIINSDKHDTLADGTIVFVDKDGSTQIAYGSGSDSLAVDSSQFDQATVQKLADMTYLSQNTGVNSADLAAVYQELGFTGTDYEQNAKKDALLLQFGYTPGNNEKFYGSNSAVDRGAQILKDRWAQAPTDSDLIAAGLNPDDYVVTNNNVANQEYLYNQLAGTGATTAASFANLNAGQTAESNRKYFDEVLTKEGTNTFWNQFESPSAAALDMLEWDLVKKQVQETLPGSPNTAGSISTISGAAIQPGYADVIPPVGGYITPKANIPDSYRNFTPAAPPAAMTPTSGTQAMNVPTYQNLFTNQVGQFVDRADAQQSYYQPQTMQEKMQQGGTAPGQIETRLFRNAQGMSMYITFVGGVPQQYIPPGYFQVDNPAAPTQSATVAQAASPLPYNMNQGGTVPKNTTIAGQPHSLAYINPDEAKLLKQVGGSGKPSYGGIPAYNTDADADADADDGTDDATTAVQQGQDLTVGARIAGNQADAIVQAQRNLLANAFGNQAGNVAATQVSTLQPEAIAGSVIESTAGRAVDVAPIVTTPAQVGQVLQADPVSATTTPAGSVAAQTAVGDIRKETAKLTAKTGAPTDTITAQQQTGSALDEIKAVQGTAIKINGPAGRQIQTDPVTGASEIISGAANAHTAAVFSEAIQHAEATPSRQATVAGQLEALMADFEGGETPAWAAGSMRTAMATLSARGLGASSLAGQAVIQAAMEAALPIAQMDAQTMAQFEAQNLSNRQQRAMLAAQQRATFIGQEFDQAFQARVSNAAKISDIANMNFTAEQQIALEDSRAANTMELSNLSNSQAVVMAQAAALANIDMANLNNRQQAEVQNAQNFLQMDMSNLSNQQQAAMFKSQQNVQALFTDQAAENAAQQFNATSENQTQQFFNNLASQTSQFNASQANAMQQFNADQANTLLEFNADLQSAREMFNAQNYLTVAQANAQWRQAVQTMNTAAINASNMEYAKQVNNLSQAALDQIWMRDRDIMDYAWRSAESSLDRQKSILIAEMQAQAQIDQAKGSALGKLFSIGGNYLMAGLFPDQAKIILGIQ